MSTLYTKETVATIWNDMLTLIECQMAEVDSSSPVPHPSYDFYAGMEDRGDLVFLAARDSNTNTLLGYSCIMYLTNHHTGEVAASVDAIYVKPEHRARGIAVRLLLACEKEVKDSGLAHTLYCSAPASNVTFHNVLGKLRYEEVETVMRKEI